MRNTSDIFPRSPVVRAIRAITASNTRSLLANVSFDEILDDLTAESDA